MTLRMALACCLACSPTIAAEPTADMLAAFKATYQESSPLVRTIEEPIHESEHPERVEVLTQTAMLAPVLLVKRGHGGYALLVSETVLNVGHAAPGAFSVAYLVRNEEGWRLEHLWPEIVFMGETGLPSDWNRAVNFTRNVFLASSTYCGMGGCAETIAVFSLDDSAPRLLGMVDGAAWFRPNYVGGSCKPYKYTAAVHAPHSVTSVLAVRYSGWSAPAGKTSPKKRFVVDTDYVSSGTELIATPRIDIPTCGR